MQQTTSETLKFLKELCETFIEKKKSFFSTKYLVLQPEDKVLEFNV